MVSEYAFGRDHVAARRLAMMHELLVSASRALLERVAGERGFDVVFDLGCGPGLTTRLLEDVLRPARLVGLDLSEPFLALARAAVPRGRFLRHDLHDLPWPQAPADLVYARYVLTHLADPEARLREWLSQLNPGGLLVVEENDWIACRQPVLARYLATVAGLLAGRGHDLYVGRRLAAAGMPRTSRVHEVSSPTAAVAAMFRLNLSSWGRHTDADVARLDRELAELERSTDHGEIVWGLRQLVFERGPEAPSSAV